ncbi:MAG: hypothetical protein ACE5QW_06415 [Thermoplasmata archaeon]
MALFKKKCAYCGMELSGSDLVERMGRKFCSVDHADRYLSSESRSAHGGCH